MCMQVYVGIENVERAAGVNPENPLTPVLVVVGGTLCIGYNLQQPRSLCFNLFCHIFYCFAKWSSSSQ